jgi:hypothetical protein
MGINKEIQFQNWLIHSLQIDCCSKKCTQLFPREDLKIFKEKFDALESQQELFIKSVLVSCQTKAYEQRRVFQYNIFPFGIMCRDAFKFLISVSNQKLLNIINDLDKGFKKRTHKNTGKVFGSHFSNDEKTSIIEWIKNWTNKNAICFTKCKNNITLWLSSDTTLVQIYNIYTLDPNTLKINLESFRRYFKTLEYIKFECNCKKQTEKKEIRFNIEELLCPISKGLMYNPVIASDGFNYEKSRIEEWIKISQKSPMTNEKILKKIYENVSLKCKIALFISEFKKDYIKLQSVIEDMRRTMTKCHLPQIISPSNLSEFFLAIWVSFHLPNSYQQFA